MRPILAKAGEVASHSVSRHARLFVVLICAAIAVGHVWQSWSARTNDIDTAHVYSDNMAKALAQHAYDTFQAADGLLLDVSDRINTLGLGSPLIAEMAPMLHRLADEMPQLDGLLVYDELGNWVVNSAERLPEGANNSDRPYFIYHRDHTDPGPLLGPALLSRSTGHWIIPMSRRLNHRDGSFAGVVLATLDLDYFTGIYRTFNVGKNGTIGLLLRNGTLLTRQPFDAKYVNRDLSDGVVFRELLPASPNGYTVGPSRMDGVHRLLNYHSVDKYPLVVTVALSEDEALAGWRQEAIGYSIAVMLLLLMIAVFGWRLIGQIELRLRAEMKSIQAMNELREANRALEMLAHRDGLTGLANRRHFDEELTKEYRRASRVGSALSLVLVDVDFFKQYNDIYGHLAGDECLRRIGALLKEFERRPGDLAVRYGGEEMLMLLPGTDPAGAAIVAEKIRAGIQALGIAHSGNPVGVVTVSAGVNGIRSHQPRMPPVDELIGQADAALYQAKHGGRNQVRVAAPVRDAA
ncbi:MAG: Phytochrome-like protein cph2 [Herbaspirillum frisingense]|uniref:diguanylate cyclase n=1 Tax=Herbaspirillum frisingense TaxID=92645 RepID=A0A7V8FZ71_9BURK|nr:MAG: Phytochrome-like protein cph2 [Herbaspirillum frisingense]